MNILLLGAHSEIAKRIITSLQRQKINIFLKNHNNDFIYDLNKDIYNVSLIDLDIVLCLGTLKDGLESEIYYSNIVYPISIIEKISNNATIINIDTTAYEYRYNAYSNSKFIFKCWLERNSHKFINLRIEHIYGYHNPKNITSFLITRMVQNKTIDLSIGTQTRNFIHIDDVVFAITVCIRNIHQLINNQTIDIASNDTISIKNLALTIKDLTHSSSRLNFGNIVVDQSEFNMIDFDNLKLKKLGWLQQTNIIDGLQNEIREVKDEISKI